MNKSLAIFAAFSSAALGAAAFAVGVVGPDTQSKANASPLGAFETPLYTHLFARGGNRVLILENGSPADGTVVYTVETGQEMLVRQLVISNGRFSTGTAEAGGLTIEFMPEPGNDGATLYYPFLEYGAHEFSFNPPVVLKPGDRISFTFKSIGTHSGYVQAAFHGEKVQTASGVAVN